jgi:hypothetical protein
MASRIDSVPPEVTVPQAGAPASAPPSMAAVIETISASNFDVLGHRSVCSGFAWLNSAYTLLRNSMCSAPP